MVIQHFLIRLLTCLALLSGLAILPGLALAEATATVDRSVVGADETFTLTVSIDSTSFFSNPNTEDLENNFTILGRQQSTRSSIINGERASQTQWIYQLSPKSTGLLTIPAIDVGGDKTSPISIKVTEADKSPTADSSKPVFMEAIVDNNSVYVQQQILFTLRINTSLNLQNIQLDEALDIPNAFLVEASNTHYERMINNTRYLTYELVYAIFPQTSGSLEIPAITASAVNPGRSNFNSFFGGGQQVRMRSQPVSIDVKPIPASAGNNPWLPAKSITLRETWSADPEDIHVGDSITRTITTTAEGLSADQLPTLNIANDVHFKTYPDQPSNNDAKNSDGIVGERKNAIALVATQPGEVTLPAINIEWWDTSNNVLKTATLPEVTLTIKGLADGSSITNNPAQIQAAPATVLPEGQAQASSTTDGVKAATTSTVDNTQLMPWKIATAISSILLLVFMALFIWQWRLNKKGGNMPMIIPPAKKDTSDEAIIRLKTACNSDNIKDIHASLLLWARTQWPDMNIQAISDIALASRNTELKDWLKKLDAHLYAGSTTQESWPELYELILTVSSKTHSNRSSLLQPLYPGK